jgi:hypothetical protein
MQLIHQLFAGLPYIIIDIWQLRNLSNNGFMGTKNSLIKAFGQDGHDMMDMFENMPLPLKNNAHIVLMGEAAQSKNIPSLADYVGPHPQNSLLGHSCLNITKSKIDFFYSLTGDIVGLDNNASFICVIKSIDATLLLALSGTIDNQDICGSQKVALATIKPILDKDKPALDRVFPVPVPTNKKQTGNKATMPSSSVSDESIGIIETSMNKIY